jgi:hypothetical protein
MRGEFKPDCRQPTAALLAGFLKGTVVFALRNDRCVFCGGLTAPKSGLKYGCINWSSCDSAKDVGENGLNRHPWVATSDIYGYLEEQREPVAVTNAR